MAGIVSALESYNHVGATRQPVDELPFTFIAPLSANHSDIRQDVILHLPGGSEQPFDRTRRLGDGLEVRNVAASRPGR